MAAIIENLNGAVATLTLNRPHALNALDTEMMQTGVEILHRLTIDDGVRVVVVTGAGRTFSAGGDLDNMKALQDGRIGFQETLRDQRLAHEFARLLHDMPKVTVAALNGHAFGAGLSIALAADLRIASDAAKFGTAFASVGLDGDLGVSWSLAKLVGEARAKELMFLPSQIDALEAQRIGLVNFVAEAARFEAETEALVARLASGPANAIRFMKQNINAAHGERFADTLEREATSHISLMNDPDFHEGVAAFLEKRKPDFGRSGALSN